MAGCHRFQVERGLREVPGQPELQPRVAFHAGAGRFASPVTFAEWLKDGILEGTGKIQDRVGNADPFAGRRRFLDGTLTGKDKGQPDEIVPFPLEENGRRRAVHAAAHENPDTFQDRMGHSRPPCNSPPGNLCFGEPYSVQYTRSISKHPGIEE